MIFKSKNKIFTCSLLVGIALLPIFLFSTSVSNQQSTTNNLSTNQEELELDQNMLSTSTIGAGFGTLGGKTNTNEVHGGKVNFDNGPIFLVNSHTTVYAFLDRDFDQHYEEIWAWGGNQSGQIGNSNRNFQLTPIRVDEIWASKGLTGEIVYFYSGDDTVFAFVDTNSDGLYDQTWGWGDNVHGTLGIDSGTDFFDSPQDLTGYWNSIGLTSGSNRIVDFYIGTNTVFAFVDSIDSDGKYDEVWGWGDDARGALGENSTGDNYSPTRLEHKWASSGLNGRIVDFYCSDDTVFAFVDTTNDGQYDEIWVWGDNINGTVGTGSGTDHYASPQNLTGTWSSMLGKGKIIDFYSGGDTVFAVIDDNDNNVIDSTDDVYGWGNGEQGALGISDDVDQYNPRSLVHGNQGPSNGDGAWATSGMLGHGEKLIDFYCGQETTFAFIDTTGDQVYDEVWGWGDNINGTVGVNSTTDYFYSPQNLTGYWSSLGFTTPSSKITHFYNGADTVFAFVDNDTTDSNNEEYDEIWVWGDNDLGTLGNGGSTGDQYYPSRAKKYSSVSNLSVDPNKTSAIVSYSWWTSEVTSPEKIKLDYRILKTSDSSVVIPWSSVPSANQNVPSTFEVSNLKPNVQYTIEVKTEIQLDSVTFTTDPEISKIKIDEIIPTFDGAKVYYYWTYKSEETPSPSLQYRVLLQSNNSEIIPWTTITSAVGNNPNVTFNITGLASNTTYILEMRTEGGDSTKVSSSFTTTNQPSTVAITNVATTSTSATITYNWSYITNTINPTLQYQVLDANNVPIISWTSVQNPTPNNPNATFTIDNLVENTSYLIQMKTESELVVSSSFTTTDVMSTIEISNITSDTENSAIVTYNWVYDVNAATNPTPTLHYQVLDLNNNVVKGWSPVVNKSPNNPNATFKIDGLVGSTTYKLQMKTESNVIVEQNFTTINEFSKISIGNITPSASGVVVTYNWTYDQDTTNPTLQYKITQGSTTTVDWTNVPNAVANSPIANFSINGLTPSTTYTLQMKTESGDITSKSFTTTNDYSVINIISVAPTTTTAVVTYNWTFDATKTNNPTLQYKVTQNSTTTIDWTNVPSPTPNNPAATFTINGLTTNTQYTLQMKTESGIIVSYAFTTIDLTSTVTIGTITPTTNGAIVAYNWVYDPVLTSNPTLEYQVLNTNDLTVVKNWTTISGFPNNPAATFTIDGLVGNTQYTLQMRTESGVIVASNFTTMGEMSQVVITSVEVDVNSAKVTYNWTYDSDTNSNSVILQYQLLDSSNSVITPWTNVQNPTPNTPSSFTISELKGNTTYTLQMRTESGIVVENIFTTNSENSIVTILNVVPNVENAVVTYNWTYDQDTANPNLQYQVLDSSNNVIQSWTDVSNPTPNDPTASFSITGLSPSTTYIVQMKTESGIVVQSSIFTTVENNLDIIIIATISSILILVFVPLVLFSITGSGSGSINSTLPK